MGVRAEWQGGWGGQLLPQIRAKRDEKFGRNEGELEQKISEKK